MLTVRELIALLQLEDPDLPVIMLEIDPTNECSFDDGKSRTLDHVSSVSVHYYGDDVSGPCDDPGKRGPHPERRALMLIPSIRKDVP